MKYPLITGGLSTVLLAGCMSASQHRQAVQDDTGEKITVGTVQKEIHVGMSGAEVATVLGSPNILSTDEERREVWIYDKVATDYAYSSSSGGISALMLGWGSQVAGVAVLQDLGYNIDESNTYLGVLTASKQADAKDTRQIVALVALGLLTGAMSPYDSKQKITLCLVIRQSLDDPNASVARITMQRIIWNSQGVAARVESIKAPELYQAFFVKLSKAAFLEANQL